VGLIAIIGQIIAAHLPIDPWAASGAIAEASTQAIIHNRAPEARILVKFMSKPPYEAVVLTGIC
jgi:hypothetical protein